MLIITVKHGDYYVIILAEDLLNHDLLVREKHSLGTYLRNAFYELPEEARTQVIFWWQTLIAWAQYYHPDDNQETIQLYSEKLLAFPTIIGFFLKIYSTNKYFKMKLLINRARWLLVYSALFIFSFIFVYFQKNLQFEGGESFFKGANHCTDWPRRVFVNYNTMEN